MNLTTAQKLGLAIGILGFVSAASSQLTSIFAPLGSAAPIIVQEIVSLATFASGILGVFVTVLTGQSGQVKAVVAMANDPTSPVQGIITTATPEGKALAASIPGPIVSAGSDKATELSKP